jgi:hypothetical protein
MLDAMLSENSTDKEKGHSLKMGSSVQDVEDKS